MADTNIVTYQQLSDAIFINTKILSPVFQFTALIANILNLATFYKIGLNDSINVTFLALSLSDLIYIAMEVCDSLCFLIYWSPWQAGIPIGMASLAGWFNSCSFVFLDTSNCLEIYMAVARCCCVTLPLRFKSLFTLRRSVAVISVVFITNVAVRVPLLSSYQFLWQTNPSTNLTKLTFYSTDTYVLLKRIEQIMDRTLIPIILFVAAVGCCIILTSALVKASIRRKIMTQPFNHKEYKHRSHHANIAANQTSEADHVTFKSKILSSKEIQLVKAVTLMTIQLGVLLLVLSVFFIAQTIVPDFFPGRKYVNLYGVMIIWINLLILCHCGCKMIIYYKLNSKYRNIIKTWIYDFLAILDKQK